MSAKNSVAQTLKLTMSSSVEQIFDQPYYGVVLQYCTLKETLSTLVLLSKYHLNFMLTNTNKKLIQKLIVNQFGLIFEKSLTFMDFYYDQKISPYHIITSFYTDFGYIQHIAFPHHHQNIMKSCNKWKSQSNSIIYLNHQYNSLKYDKTPFDFTVLTDLQSPDLLIHWLQFIMKRRYQLYDIEPDLYSILLNVPSYRDEILGADHLKVSMITAINDNKTREGAMFLIVMIRNVINWPTNKFSKIIDFMLKNSCIFGLNAYLFGSICCWNLMFFVKADDKEISYENFKVYLEMCLKWKSNSSLKFDSVLSIISQSAWEPDDIYTTMQEVVMEKYKDSLDMFEDARNNQHFRNIFGEFGSFLRYQSDKKDIKRYLTYIKQTYASDRYFTLFCDLFGFQS